MSFAQTDTHRQRRARKDDAELTVHLISKKLGNPISKASPIPLLVCSQPKRPPPGPPTSMNWNPQERLLNNTQVQVCSKPKRPPPPPGGPPTSMKWKRQEHLLNKDYSLHNNLVHFKLTKIKTKGMGVTCIKTTTHQCTYIGTYPNAGLINKNAASTNMSLQLDSSKLKKHRSISPFNVFGKYPKQGNLHLWLANRINEPSALCGTDQSGRSLDQHFNDDLFHPNCGWREARCLETKEVWQEFWTLRKVYVGEELTIDYGYENSVNPFANYTTPKRLDICGYHMVHKVHKAALESMGIHYVVKPVCVQPVAKEDSITKKEVAAIRFKEDSTTKKEVAAIRFNKWLLRSSKSVVHVRRDDEDDKDTENTKDSANAIEGIEGFSLLSFKGCAILPPPVVAGPVYAIAQHDFNPCTIDQIQIKLGQPLRVLQKGTNGWTRGVNVATGESGWFPTGYASIGRGPSRRRQFGRWI